MKKRLAPLVLLLGAASGTAMQGSPDAALDSAIRLYTEGRLEQANAALEALVDSLRPAPPAHTHALITALLYRGAALVGLGQEWPARASFEEALAYDRTLRLDPQRFPPRVVRVFEAVRLGRSQSVLLPPRGVAKRAGVAALAATAAGAAALVIGSPPRSAAAPSSPAASVTPSPAAANRPPLARISGVQPSGIGVFNVTQYTLVATASDPDGDALSYTWELGDGSSKTGPNVAHTFPHASVFEVRLTVDDGRGGSASDYRAVKVGSLAGEWGVQYGAERDRATVLQNENGRNIVGRFNQRGLAFSGTVRSPRELEISVLHGACTATYRGSAFENLQLIPMSGGGCPGAASPISFTR